MTEALLDLVNAELLPTITPLGFKVVETDVSEWFDNAYVILEAPALRVRVLRERSIVVVGFGPTSEPGTWFDSAVLVDYLGLSANAGFHDRDARGVLRGAGAFITSMWNELTAKFSPPELATTKKELRALAEERAAKMFGG